MSEKEEFDHEKRIYTLEGKFKASEEEFFKWKDELEGKINYIIQGVNKLTAPISNWKNEAPIETIKEKGSVMVGQDFDPLQDVGSARQTEEHRDCCNCYHNTCKEEPCNICHDFDQWKTETEPIKLKVKEEITENIHPDKSGRKYKISGNPCKYCSGLISWDEYDHTKKEGHAIHVDGDGHILGDGSCPHWRD